MRSVTLSRCRFLHAWACAISLVAAIPASTNAQEARNPAGRPQPTRLFDRSGAYEYGYDPYDGKMDSRGYGAQGYSAYAERFYTRPRTEVVLPARPVRPSAEAFGYVEPEGAPEEVGAGGQGAIFGYYYDPETGDLAYGWHEVTGQEAPRRAPVDWRAVTREPVRAPTPPQGEARPPEREIEQFRGQVIDSTTYTDRSSNRIHLVAQIRQPDETLRAIEMGPFATTTVRKGDWIEGFGPRAVIRGRPMILARHVAVNGVWQAIETPSSEVSNFAGEILSLRSVPLTGRPGAQTIAEVRLGTNDVQTVILGPTSAIRDHTHFAAGDQIAFWARRGTLDGLPALVATQIDLGTTVLNIEGTGVSSSSADLLIPVE